MFFNYIAFALGHLFLCLLLIAIPHAPATGTSLLPIPEALIIFVTLGSLVLATGYALVYKIIGARPFLVFCNWSVLQCLCVRITGLLSLAPTSFIVPIASCCILAVVIEYVHLRVAIQEQATNQIQDLTLPPSQQYVDELLFRISAIAGLGSNIGAAALASGQGAVGVNAMGSGQGATGGNTVGSAMGSSGGTAAATPPPSYFPSPHSQPLQGDKLSDFSLV
ncbi:hypothetical protein GGX14DRAFT_566129 [Mycena pura]|uniref:Uncharacterized protein n=1 Tax=Mycena pura TaxID=153505 RepID=A0AAD6VH12_9AGAR|nr:hypothetical protein GGX14DRAFT_566129 [Mycena pura]